MKMKCAICGDSGRCPGMEADQRCCCKTFSDCPCLGFCGDCRIGDELLPTRVTRDSAPARGVGALLLTTKPYADVFLDGKLLGRTPKISRIELKPGKYRLRVSRSKFIEHSEELQIRAGQSVRRQITLVAKKR